MSLDAFQRPEDNRGLKNYKTPEIAADSYSLAVTGADVLSAVDILFRPRRDLSGRKQTSAESSALRVNARKFQ